MKDKSIFLYVKCKNWLYSRRSADQTMEKSFWTWLGIVAVVVVFTGLLGIFLYMNGYIKGFAEDITTGNKTEAPGGWGSGGK